MIVFFVKKPKEFKTAEDINDFIANENPYEDITDKEKLIINHIGTSFNNVIRKNPYSALDKETKYEIDLLQRLIKKSHIKGKPNCS